METKPVPAIKVLFQVVGIWIASDIGYYVLLPLLGLPANYNLSPFSITAYYVFWVIFSLNILQPIFRGWKLFQNPFWMLIYLCISAAMLGVFAVYILPLLPAVHWIESWDPPQLLVANSWYFLPKAVEILLQQILISALVISLAVHQFSARTISIMCMVLFGFAHLLLAFNGSPVFYVARFTLSAMVFGYLFPNLILRVPNGFVYSYTLHWLYYAVSAVMAHTISPYAS